LYLHVLLCTALEFEVADYATCAVHIVKSVQLCFV